MKYKVGDKVKVHTKEWFRTNCSKNCIGAFKHEDDVFTFVSGMEKFCEQEITINEECLSSYKILEDAGLWHWEDWMFEDMNNNTNIIYNPNIVEDFAKLIGVELDEEFYNKKSGQRYKFTANNGLMIYNDKQEDWCVSLVYPSAFFKMIEEGRFIKKWTPKNGDIVYFPAFKWNNLYDYTEYSDDYEHDKEMVKNGLYFKTQKEAVECAKKIINQMKEG